MTRRKFIIRLITAGLAVAIGAFNIVRKVKIRKFVRAVRFGRYPGPLKSLRDISEQGIWKG
jgi:hypothetical protein